MLWHESNIRLRWVNRAKSKRKLSENQRKTCPLLSLNVYCVAHRHKGKQNNATPSRTEPNESHRRSSKCATMIGSARIKGTSVASNGFEYKRFDWMCKMCTTVSTELRSKTDLSTGSVRIPFGTMWCVHIRFECTEKDWSGNSTTACDDNDYINNRE